METQNEKAAAENELDLSIFYEALNMAHEYYIENVPDTIAGKKQRKFINEVNSTLKKIQLLPTDTTIEFFQIDPKSIVYGLTYYSIDSFGINECFFFRNINPTRDQLVRRCLEEIFSYCWREIALSINADKFRSLCGPPSVYKSILIKRN